MFAGKEGVLVTYSTAWNPKTYDSQKKEHLSLIQKIQEFHSESVKSDLSMCITMAEEKAKEKIFLETAFWISLTIKKLYAGEYRCWE